MAIRKIEIQKNILVALFIVGILSFFAYFGLKSPKNSSDLSESLNTSGFILGQSTINFCDILGLETGVVASQPSGFDSYYSNNLGVIATVVCPGEIEQSITEVINSPAIINHVVRLGSAAPGCYFSPKEAADYIAELKQRTRGTSFDVLVQPVNEPRTDLSQELGEDPIAHVNWLNELMNYLKSNSDSAVSNTMDYIIFPAFNYHNPDGANSDDYISRFIINYDGDINSDFYAFSVSLQKEAGYPPMLDRVQRFSNLLTNLGVANQKIALFSANVVNAVADDSFVDELFSIINEYNENLIGIYIFSPWGWSSAESPVHNEPISEEIWNKIFEQCKNLNKLSEYSCKENPVDKLPSLSSCQSLGEKNHLFGGVRVARNDEGKRVAKPIITIKTDVTFLNWLSDSNYFNKLKDPNFEGPSLGTYANRILAPCGSDRFLNFNENYDLTKVFSGTIKFKSSGGYEFNYKMPALGNALACMIWNSADYSSDSIPLNELENRFFSSTITDFQSTVYDEDSKDLLKDYQNGLKDWLISLAGRFSSDKYGYCNGWVTRIEESDKLEGPELIVLDEDVDLSDDDVMCQKIQNGQIDIGWVRFDQVCKKGADGKYTYIEGLANPYYKMDYGATDEIEILGGGKALASMWLEETQNNPWGGNLEIMHRDKAGIKVTVTQFLYDGLTGSKEYSNPLNTVEEQCRLFEYNGDKALSPSSNFAGVPGSPQGETEYVVPWFGQILNMQKRKTLIFNNFKDSTTSLKSDYLKSRRQIINDFIQNDDSALDVEKLGLILYQLFKPDNLFQCRDLDNLKQYILDQKNEINDSTLRKQIEIVRKIIENTDCLADKEKDMDPLNQWLCEKNLINKKYCKFECVPTEDIFDTTDTACIIKSDILCYQATRGKLSHWQYTDDLPLDLYSAKVGNSRNFSVIAPDDIKILSYMPSYYYGENLCGAKMVVESLTVPGLIMHLNHFDPSTVVKTNRGDIYRKGEYIGELIQLHNNCVAGAHLHFYAKYYPSGLESDPNSLLHDKTSGYENVNPYTLLELWGCGKVTCTPYSTDDKDALDSAVNAYNLYKASSEFNINSTVYDQCYTTDGRFGRFLGKSTIPENFNYESYFRGKFLYESEDVVQLHENILNLCGLNIPACDIGCKEQIKTTIIKVANVNGTGEYSDEDISYFIDRMYAETRDMSQMNFQTLVAMWLSENGLNPRFKNPDHDSDIWGCGVYCSIDKPQNFDEELACVLGKPYPDGHNPQCGVFYPFESESPGNYLEVFAPITDGNATYAEKVILVLERLLLLQGVSVSDLRTGDRSQCNLYPTDPPTLINASWVSSILDTIYPVDNTFYER